MSAAPTSVDTALPSLPPEISAAADRARERLHEEIERVRAGVEEMLDAEALGSQGQIVKGELEDLREETRRYVKQRVGKAEKRIEKSVERLDERTRWLEHRIDTVERDRERTEWRIHRNVEGMLDGLLRDMRTVADRLTPRY